VKSTESVMTAALRRTGALMGTAIILALASTPSAAQVRGSEHATLSQVIDGTVLSMEWHRPSLRGRESLFGGQIHWGEIWTPGANWATILQTSKDVVIEDVPVPTGRYSVWMVVEEVGDWEVILDPRDSLFHTNRPEASVEQIRFPVEPRVTDDFMETLAWSFPSVRWNGGELRMHWGRTLVEMTLEVESSYRLTMPATEAAPYLGSYTVLDIAPEGSSWQPEPYDITLVHDGERLLGNYPVAEPIADQPAPSVQGTYQMLLVPRETGFFFTGFTLNGEVVQLDDSSVLEFLFDQGGNPTGFEIRGPDDTLWSRGARKQ